MWSVSCSHLTSFPLFWHTAGLHLLSPLALCEAVQLTSGHGMCTSRPGWQSPIILICSQSWFIHWKSHILGNTSLPGKWEVSLPPLGLQNPLIILHTLIFHMLNINVQRSWQWYLACGRREYEEFGWSFWMEQNYCFSHWILCKEK